LKRHIKKVWKFLALWMLTAVLVHVNAAAGEENAYMDYKEAGFSFRLTDAFNTELKGFLSLDGGQELGYASGIYNVDLLYVGMSLDEYNGIASKSTLTQEEQEKLQGAVWYLFRVFAVNGGRDFSAVCDFFRNNYEVELDETYAREITRDGDCVFYRYDAPYDEFLQRIEPEFAEEYERLLKESDVMLEDAKYAVPVSAYSAYIGKPFSFETTDMEGNPVSSEELFAQHEITLVNLWTTWCPYCIDEMEELEEINGRLAEKDCAVVGLLCDGNADGAKEKGVKILKDTGVTYTTLMPPDDLDTLFPVSAYPTSLFVDRNGILMAEPVLGAKYWLYEDAIDTLRGQALTQ